jgi:hypothetical protein
MTLSLGILGCEPTGPPQTDRQKQAVWHNGRHALTTRAPLIRRGHPVAAVMDCWLETGRTHKFAISDYTGHGSDLWRPSVSEKSGRWGVAESRPYTFPPSVTWLNIGVSTCRKCSSRRRCQPIWSSYLGGSEG